jgi:hypothetical protein
MQTIKQLGRREQKVPLMQPIKILKMKLKETQSSKKNSRLKRENTKKLFSCLEPFQEAVVLLATPTQMAMNYSESPA